MPYVCSSESYTHNVYCNHVCSEQRTRYATLRPHTTEHSLLLAVFIPGEQPVEWLPPLADMCHAPFVPDSVSATVNSPIPVHEVIAPQVRTTKKGRGLSFLTRITSVKKRALLFISNLRGKDLVVRNSETHRVRFRLCRI